MKIVVIGGTGLIGSKTVAQLQQRGHEAVAAAPNTGVNTITGDGLADALAGAAVVIDVSNSPSLGEKEAMDFFATSARNIAAAERTAGVRHLGREIAGNSAGLREKPADESAQRIDNTHFRRMNSFGRKPAVIQRPSIGCESFLNTVHSFCDFMRHCVGHFKAAEFVVG